MMQGKRRLFGGLLVATLVMLVALLGLGAPVAAGDRAGLAVSQQSDRVGSVPLEGSVLGGAVYIFVPDGGTIGRVRFWLDDPEREEPPRKDERNAPWDFAGTAKDRSALAFDTSTLPDGPHVVTALVDFTDGTSETVHGSFDIDNTTPVLTASPASLDVAAEPDGPVSERPVQLTSSEPDVSVALVSDQAWLTTSPSAGVTPLETVVHVDPDGLAPGTHVGKVTVHAVDHPPVQIVVTLAVGNPPGSSALLVSQVNTRTPSAPLESRTVKGDIFVFVPSKPGLQAVRFWLDDADRSGSPYRTEKSAPYDLAGGTVSVASPLRTTRLADGAHNVTAELSFTDQSRTVLAADFVIANSGPVLSFAPERETVSVPESRSTVTLRPRLSATDGSASVQLDSDVDWLSADACCVSVPAEVTVTVDPTLLADGRHVGTLTATAAGYGTASYKVELLVAGEPPTQVHLAWVSDPSTSMTVIWHTESPVPSELEYRPSGEATWRGVAGAPRPSGGAGTLHEVAITGLHPGMRYEYRVPGDGTAKSVVRTFRTAPAQPSSFDAVYFADTGIVGRSDGLTSGTADVIEEIAAMRPLLTLPGGDYAYFDSDKRFGTLDEAIDAWFRQVEPFAANAPMMPTYGNHEVLLKEGYLPWASRFPTPSGHDDRRSYSFDVGPVHFVSILAVYGQAPLPTSQLRWLRSDLEAARDAGQTWLVPYMHVSAFADGAVHPSNIALREQLGPVFEEHGVDLVLMSHDQSYERTWPLVDVPASNRPTSTDAGCVSRTDGVTWVKVSPAGKMSNKTGGFSPWVSEPAPPWTAVRSNTQHHFAVVQVRPDDLTLRVVGVPGNGAPSFVVDQVRFAAGDC